MIYFKIRMSSVAMTSSSRSSGRPLILSVALIISLLEPGISVSGRTFLIMCVQSRRKTTPCLHNKETRTGGNVRKKRIIKRELEVCEETRWVWEINNYEKVRRP
jgi:hypothetical protein